MQNDGNWLHAGFCRKYSTQYLFDVFVVTSAANKRDSLKLALNPRPNMAPNTGVVRLQGDEVLLCRWKLAEHSPVNIS